MKPCAEPDCDRASRARGMCRAHYQRDRRARGLDTHQPPTRRVVCQELDCRRRAQIRFTWPEPINRTETHCHRHAQVLLGSRLPLMYEELGAE